MNEKLELYLDEFLLQLLWPDSENRRLEGIYGVAEPLLHIRLSKYKTKRTWRRRTFVQAKVKNNG